jgi:hypothetical protein
VETGLAIVRRLQGVSGNREEIKQKREKKVIKEKEER